jgi:hypothetical protein
MILTEGKPTSSRTLFNMFNMLYRIAAAPLFPKLRRFPHGRRFKQWTGDDSKALMKVCMFLKSALVYPEVVTYYP